jgi:CubicO group peptidase (beta-lactamase class C family)
LAFLVVLSLPQHTLAQAVDSDAIDAIVRDALKFWRVPGVAVGIVRLGDRRDDQVVYLKGHGVKEMGKADPVTPDTIFPLASCTKAFTTTAMAMLVDEGKMNWDDPVRKHVEFFHLSDPSADALVTLRDLVSHRTGVGSHELLWYRAPWSQEETIRKIGKVKLDYPFRSGFRYQTTMFTTAGWAVGRGARKEQEATEKTERAASRLPQLPPVRTDSFSPLDGWAVFVQKRILDPLEMRNTSVTTAKALASADHASPHRLGSEGRFEVIPWYTINKPEPAGSVNSCARDLCQWMRFQLADGIFAGKQLVSAKNLQETRTPQTIIRLEGNVRDMNPDTTQISYGMGWVVQDHRGQLLVSHAGGIDGFRAHITLIPKAKIGIVLLNNLDKTHMNLAVSNNLVDLLLGLPKKDWNAYVGEQVRKQETAARARYQEREKNRKPESRPSLPLSAYAGTYDDPAYGTAVIALKDNSLVWKWSSIDCRLEHFADDMFTIESDLLGHPRVQFIVGSGDKVNTMKVMDVMEVEFKRKP